MASLICRLIGHRLIIKSTQSKQCWCGACTVVWHV